MSEKIKESRINTLIKPLQAEANAKPNILPGEKVLPLSIKPANNVFDAFLNADFTPRLQQLGAPQRPVTLLPNTVPDPNKSSTLEERLIKPLIPKINPQQKTQIIAALDKVENNIRRQSVNIRRLNMIDHLDPVLTDEKLLGLKLIDSGVTAYDKRITYYIADAFNDVDHLSKDKSNSEKLDIINGLVNDLKVDIQKYDPNNQPVGKHRPLVAVIDDFEGKKLVDIDGDGTCDFQHGKLVTEIMKAHCKTIDTVEFNASEGKVSGSVDMPDVTDELNRVLRYIRRGYQFDGLNLSFGGDMPVEIKDKNGNTHNVTDMNRDTLLNIFWTIGLVSNSGTEHLVKQIDIIERIAETTPVYIAAGNNGEKFFCLYALAKSLNVHIVGATDHYGKKSKYSANNKFITDWAKGSYDIKEITHRNDSGYDINGDNIVDIRKNDSRLSKGPKRRTNFFESIFQSDSKSFHGTSFSSPAALSDSLRKKFNPSF